MAVGSVEYGKSVNCDPATVSGPRFSPDFDHHLNFCKGARPADANFEDKERFRITQECRIAAGKPQGTVGLQVAQNDGSFLLTGSGYEVNTRVIIRATDAAGVQRNITSNRSDAAGNLVASVSTADVCTVAGLVTFTAEDQDKKASTAVTGNCPPPAAAGQDQGSPIAGSAESFKGSWDMQMSDGAQYVLVLTVDGDKVNGTFKSPAKENLSGTVSGSLPRRKNGRFEYTFSQPGTGLSSFGVMTVHEDGTIKGTLDNASDGQSYTWSGRRSGTDAAEKDEAGEPPPGNAEQPAGEDGAAQPPPPNDGDVADGGVDQTQPANGFAGTWDMRNQRGTRFLLTLKVSEGRVTGRFVTPGKPNNTGTLSGQVTDGTLDYTFEQPRLRVRGTGRLTVENDNLQGNFTVENNDNEFSWSGGRTARGEN